MLEIAEREGIIVEHFNFSSPLNGVYWVSPFLPPVITLAERLKKNPNRMRCVFAEELGHHFTSAGICIPNREFYCYSERTEVTKAEYKALRWAAHFLIPEDELLDAISSGLYEPWEIAEHFRVTDEFATFRLRLFGARKMA